MASLTTKLPARSLSCTAGTVSTFRALTSRTHIWNPCIRYHSSPFTSVPVYRYMSALSVKDLSYYPQQNYVIQRTQSSSYQHWQNAGRRRFATSASQRSKLGGLLISAVVATTGGLGFMLFMKQKTTLAEEQTVRAVESSMSMMEAKPDMLEDIPVKTESPEGKCGVAIPGLPVYTESEVIPHDDKVKGIWCTYKDAVYDITEFVDQHPGGDRVMMAAGGSLDPFWEVFEIHKKAHVFSLLEEYRIGNLSKEGRTKHETDRNDPFWNDPPRHPAIIPSSKKPFNGEPPSDILIAKYITPEQFFYVRNHLPVPEVDPVEYSLVIETDDGRKTIELSLDELKKYEKHTITATLQCAGNRRSDMARYREVKGLNWKQSAIGTAKWSGVKLRDVLLQAGVREHDPDIKHIQFEGLDTDPFTSEQYGASVPVKKAMDPEGDVILAYEMNGEPLARDHGYPIRVIVPGYVGARNVKWLTRIIASDEESQSHWQQNDYKGFSPSITMETADYSKETAIQEYPVQSAVCIPVDGTKVPAESGEVTVKGYAWSGGGRGILRVDVSLDGGKTWKRADLQHEPQSYGRNWAWTFWELDVPLPENHKGELEIICKAVDSAYNVQPNSYDGHWNFRGVLANAWSHTKIYVE
ncbi:sulfite oxidase-like [Glandiceps talaboti]